MYLFFVFLRRKSNFEDAYRAMCEVHKLIIQDEDSFQVFLDSDFVGKVSGRIESEVNKNDILTAISPPSRSTSESYTLADESISVITSSSSSSSSLHPNVFLFLFINEFCLTIADFPSSYSDQLEMIVDSSIPSLLLRIIQFLTKITTAKLLSGKTGSLVTPVSGAGLSALVGAVKKLTTSVSFIDASKPPISFAAPGFSHSSSPSAVSVILSDVYHALAYSSVSALLSVVKYSEQNQTFDLVENLNVLQVVVNFLTKVCGFFVPTSSSKLAPAISPHYFPSFLVRAINLIEVFL
jgi:hypothetical protein